MVKSVVTVIGQDRVGIIAGISNVLADSNVNILDISQTTMQDVFTMIMLVDISRCKCTFEELSEHLSSKGNELKLTVNIQHQDIFYSMHRI